MTFLLWVGGGGGGGGCMKMQTWSTFVVVGHGLVGMPPGDTSVGGGGINANLVDICRLLQGTSLSLDMGLVGMFL